MSGKNFKENLKTDNVAADKSNILPNIGANKQRLEVEKIEKIISDVTDGNFDKLANDDKINAIALNISKKPIDNSYEYIITLRNNEVEDNFNSYIQFFNNEKNSIITPIYNIERLVKW